MDVPGLSVSSVSVNLHTMSALDDVGEAEDFISRLCLKVVWIMPGTASVSGLLCHRLVCSKICEVRPLDSGIPPPKRCSSRSSCSSVETRRGKIQQLCRKETAV